MTAKVLDGSKIAGEILDDLQAKITNFKSFCAFAPGLAIIQVGERDDARVYIAQKMEAASKIGMDVEHFKLPQKTTEADLIALLEKLNDDSRYHGIVVQLPFDAVPEIDAHRIVNKVTPSKDINGLTNLNMGGLAAGELDDCVVPCAPRACLELIKSTGMTIAGKTAVVVGRTRLVGTPVAELLKWHDANVTICHAESETLPEILKQGDIVIVDIGIPRFIDGTWIKNGALVLDCGFTTFPDPTSMSGVKVLGDVDFTSAAKFAGWITPVPGGVQPLAIAMLLRNAMDQAVKWARNFQAAKWTFQPLSLQIKSPVPSDNEISQAQMPKDVAVLASEVGLLQSEVEVYGHTKAKISLDVLSRLRNRPLGKYVVVTAVTPTHFGEGKSTTTLGVSQAMGVHLRRNVFTTMRQPSQGPLFGIKGGAAGGGYSQIIPMDEFNVHLSGEIHAVTAATNLLAAALDARMLHEASQSDRALFDRLVHSANGGQLAFVPSQLQRLEKLCINKTNPNELTDDEIRRFARLDIDKSTITWQRVLDTNDRFLRKIKIGLADTEKGHDRECQFDNSATSELMAILALSRDLKDMRQRIGRIVVAFDTKGFPVTAEDLGVAGAVAVLMKGTIRPTLMQTLEGTPVFVHAGLWANIALGSSSIISDEMALRLVGENGFVFTEVGMGADMGLEKFMDIKCHYSGLRPSAVVLVATVRALKMHGGGPTVTPGSPLPSEYESENVELVEKGCANNLKKQVQNAAIFGVPVIVSINRFVKDTKAELAVIRKHACEAGAVDAVISNSWAEGGKGAITLAETVERATNTASSSFRFLYNFEMSLEEKILVLATKIYGAAGVEYSEEAKRKLAFYTKQGFGRLPICLAKTHLSLGHDPTQKGAPTGFTLPICDCRVAAGAGFVVPFAGEISTMPGLPTRPCYFDIDLDLENGQVLGLF